MSVGEVFVIWPYLATKTSATSLDLLVDKLVNFYLKKCQVLFGYKKK